MLKQATIGAAALLIGGSMLAYAQQPPGNPGVATTAQPAQPVSERHASPQDMSAFADARIAALHAGLVLNADQEKNWAPFETALREMAKMRIARMEAREKAMAQPPSQPPNPIERLQKRADAMATRGAALKRLADAAAPLYQSLDDAQKHRFAVLARVLRPHDRHRVMWRGRDDDGMDRGMDRGMGPRAMDRGMERDFHHRFGEHGMHDQRRNDDGDYRGPL